jgi:hypothetical protein
MSDWLKKQLERDRKNAEIEAQRQNTIGSKAPGLWNNLQQEFKECISLFRAQYPDGATYEFIPDNKIEIRRPGGKGFLDLVFDPANHKISYMLRNQAGSNEGVLDIDLNDRRECYLRQGMDRYETMDDVSSFLLRPLLYG